METKISKELDKFLNERVRDLLLRDVVTERVKVGWRIKVGWDGNRVYWGEKRKGQWVLRSGRRWPRGGIVVPRELDVDLGVYSASLSGIIPWRGDVSGCM